NHRSLGEEVAVKLLAAASGTGQWEDQGAAAPRGLLPLPPRLPCRPRGARRSTRARRSDRRSLGCSRPARGGHAGMDRATSCSGPNASCSRDAPRSSIWVSPDREWVLTSGTTFRNRIVTWLI